MKKALLWMALFAISATAFSQSGRQIMGKVSDDGGEPIPGVSIMEKGTTNGTITDIEGNYNITLSGENAILVYSFIGFRTQEMAVNNQTTLDVVLIEAFTDLDEVVVVGYGEVRKSDLTGAVASVRERDEIARQYPTVDMLLQGRASGVQVISNGGSPGSAISVRIRGTNSLRGINEPLYVVDGVIINSAAEDVDTNTSGDSNEMPAAQNGLTGLNANDIENVEILKDASATAIYGSRGANGVVIITTKSGQSGKDDLPKVNVYTSVDITKMNKKIDVLDGLGYANYQNEYAEMQGNDLKYHIEDGTVYPLVRNDDNELVPGSDSPYLIKDWQDEVYQMGVSQNSGLSIGGNKGKTKYYFSGAYSDLNGIVETNNIKRGDLRVNLSTPLSNRLSMDTRISLMYQKGSFANGGSRSGGTRSFTKQVLGYRPLVGALIDQDADVDNDLEVSNPGSWLTDYKDITEEVRSNISQSFTFELLKGLKYKLNLGLDYRTKDRSKWYGKELFKGEQANGVANYSNLKRYSYSVDNLLVFNRNFNKRHNLNATIGFTYDGSKVKDQLYEVSDFLISTLEEEVPQNGAFTTVPYALKYMDQAINSYLGRAVYSLNDKYIVTATFRSDKSSKFAPGNRTGYFPSASIAWRAMEESVIKDLNVFDNLKLRAGWGLTGNQAIVPYQTLATYTDVVYVQDDKSVIGYVPERIPNPDLTWETTEQINVGADLAFFNSRLRATFDIYKKNTRDLLQDIPIGSSNGFASIWVNRGEIENHGLEFSIDGTILEKKDLMVDLGGHISFNKGKLKNLGLAPEKIYINGEEQEAIYFPGSNISSGTYFKFPANIFMEGEEVGLFWGHETRGVYAPSIVDYVALYGQETADKYAAMFNPGDMIIVDHNGDGAVSDADKTIIGNPNPDFTYGFSLNVSYKNLSLSALFDGVYGNEVINGYNTELAFAEGQSKNILTEAYTNAWRADAPSVTHTALGYRLNQSTLPDVLVEDGSYFRMNNVTLSYNFKVKQFAGIENVNIYATGKNLFVLTNYSGYNPQITSFLYDGTIMGVDWTGSPDVRTYLLGINVAF
jgi:TonB-linked SusC/RagA family outer membrane protein